ncbi:toll/interleukin-1 receptor domain-containing protein [Variovorax sp. J2P1-59]|uniref:toll/interleukin-1 receptor domain-containing protein n=1 Tax=Variovorax flavidus TaxID=3053501 RepID=UPI0025787EB5|nr:toll/interleukin-1 receptor domain-containing protein [Variovorax sp. J2P1-59]MDM0075740.1 toll/interleukin-1 receptor domain-containing protein [Variovorax sp. J2P1-59]
MASVFFPYSHKDEAFRDQLESHLALQGLIDAWHDRRITAGEEVDAAIFGKLEAADIILLLVSSDFISSSYCYSREMARAMERHEAGQARVIPVILRHCMWHDAPFGKLMAVPLDGRPIASWPDRDEAMAQVAAEVAKAVKSVGGGAAPAGAVQPRSAAIAASSADAANPRSSNL